MTGPEATLRDELIQQVWVIDAVSQTDQVCDVLIQRGRITAIAPSLSEVPPDVTVLEGRGKLLIPGLVDLYSHSGEPGFESRETLKISTAVSPGRGLYSGRGFYQPLIRR